MTGSSGHLRCPSCQASAVSLQTPFEANAWASWLHSPTKLKIFLELHPFHSSIPNLNIRLTEHWPLNIRPMSLVIYAPFRNPPQCCGQETRVRGGWAVLPPASPKQPNVPRSNSSLSSHVGSRGCFPASLLLWLLNFYFLEMQVAPESSGSSLTHFCKMLHSPNLKFLLCLKPFIQFLEKHF